MRVGSSERLFYETLSSQHATLLHEALTDPKVLTALDVAEQIDIDALTSDFARRAAGPHEKSRRERWVNLAVALNNNVASRYIGRLEATVYDEFTEIAYVFGSESWGYGYATESMMWFHQHLTEQGVSKIFAAISPTNIRSLALCKRLGYREVGSPLVPMLASYETGDVCVGISLG